MTANQTMQLVGSWPDLGRALVGSWATLGHFWGILGRFGGTLGPIGRALVGICVDGDLDPVGIVFLRDNRLREAVFLPVSVKIGKAHAGAFANVDLFTGLRLFSCPKNWGTSKYGTFTW